jgi:hypothetical protein
MKTRPTQSGVRENTASSRRHASHLTVDSLAPMSEALPRDLHQEDKSIITIPVEAATGGETGGSATAFSAPSTVITGAASRQVLVTPEPFVSADEAAEFLCVKRRYLLELARRGITGAYALGTGSKRKIWVFRLSELAASIVRSETSIPKQPKPCTIGSGSPR